MKKNKSSNSWVEYIGNEIEDTSAISKSLDAQSKVNLPQYLTPWFFYLKERNNISADFQLLVLPTDREALEFNQKLQELGLKSEYFPATDLMNLEDLAVIAKQKEVLKKISKINYLCLSIHVLLFSLPFSALDSHTSNYQQKNLTYTKLLKILEERNYQRVDLVESKGQYAVRGSLIDFFSPLENHPYRLDFFDEELTEVKFFDLLNQRTVQKLNTSENSVPDISIPDLSNDAINSVDDEQIEVETTFNSIFDFLPQDTTSNKISSKAFSSGESSTGTFTTYFIGKEKISTIIEKLSKYREINYPKIEHQVEIETLNIDKGYEKVNLFSQKFDKLSTLIDYIKNNAETNFVLLTPSQTQNDRLKADLERNDLSNVYLEQALNLEQVRETEKKFITCAQGLYSDSLDFPDLVLLNLEQVLGLKNNLNKSDQVVQRKKQLQLVDLKIGDFVVHEEFGIGLYQGLEFKPDFQKEYLIIEYRPSQKGFPNDRLYVPTEKLGRITKYVGNDLPKISHMGSGNWKLTKEKAKRYIKDIARTLIHASAQRKSEQGFAFSDDTKDQYIFESEFEFIETPDQLTIIEQVKKDMESELPMDRLILGDVGFGKTEIALRASFKAVQDRKQVAVVAPTTILASQHFQTFQSRFEMFDTRIALLSSFNSPEQNKKIREDLVNGNIDIVIGTHSIIQPSTKFLDLGLIIIDEEQRFGVEQKEMLRAAKNSVDVLSLSATPIPRTLEMSLSGIKSLSVLTTPPENRLPIKTFVGPRNEQIIYEAIIEEVSRGGQVFYLYNNVVNIEKKTEQLIKLFSEQKNKLEKNFGTEFEIRFGIAHGKMSQKELEATIEKFTNKEIDVLVCSTIIENGLDIPNANTLIVENAEKFGISQMHQIRGRVGRSLTQSYAYFLYSPNKVLTETALERLNSLKNFSQLGAGFQLAQKDLEIRGAGNLLGVEQSGHIAGVGFDLYMKMLAQEIERIKNNQQSKGSKPTLSGNGAEENGSERSGTEANGTGIKANGKVISKEKSFEEKVQLLQILIPRDYISNDTLRLEIYQKFASAKNKEEAQEILEEMKDRFGPLPSNLTKLRSSFR